MCGRLPCDRHKVERRHTHPTYICAAYRHTCTGWSDMIFHCGHHNWAQQSPTNKHCGNITWSGSGYSCSYWTNFDSLPLSLPYILLLDCCLQRSRLCRTDCRRWIDASRLCAAVDPPAFSTPDDKRTIPTTRVKHIDRSRKVSVRLTRGEGSAPALDEGWWSKAKLTGWSWNFGTSIMAPQDRWTGQRARR